ncbi:MAG: hypothetical protein NTY96_07575 [Bacteroidetes bacterium]|nr:hypothetical protein [Bacteroidota bacterium]
MKATTIIIATILTLQLNVLFAGNKSTSAPVYNENTITTIVSLAPTTPNEATFEDISFEMVSSLDLAPITPVVADFEEVNDLAVDLTTLAPISPDEADFE